MSSSTSGFSASPTHCLAAFLATAGLLFGLNARRNTDPNVPPFEFISENAAPERYYVINDESAGVLEHTILFHGLKGTHEALRKADVVLLGNSRLMVALPQEALRPFFGRYGLNYYALGFSIEASAFPEAIIRNVDVRPRLIIANADRFFTDKIVSPWGRAAVKEDAFRARKRIFEADAGRALRHALHPYAPHLLNRNLGIDEFTVYRSLDDGTWEARKPGKPRRFQDDPNRSPEVTGEDLEAASAFKARMEARGAALVLLYVPTPGNTRRHAEIIARHLGVPLISPTNVPLETNDGSHLSAACVPAFSAACLQELARLMPAYGFAEIRR